MRRIFIIVALLSLVLTVPARAEQEKKHVLFLNSYQNGYAWSDDILRGLQAGLKESGDLVDLQIEYLDSKKFPDDVLKRMLFDYYKYKYRNTRFDVIVVSDNYAFEFMRELQSGLFPGLPVVFCGVNDFHDEMLEGHENFTGVVENPDIEATLEIALKLHPEKRRMLVIGDRSVTGIAIQNQIRAVEHRLEGRLEFEFWDTLSLEEILEGVKGVGPDTFIFLIPFYMESSQQVLSVNEVLRKIYDIVKVPVYSSWEFMLGSGIVGGRLHSGVQEGRIAANMALRIMAGAAPSALPVIKATDDKFLFDYQVLHRLSISRDLLPAGSSLVNEPPSLYEINVQVIWTIIVSFTVLLFILFLLATSIVERKSAEEKIKDQLSFLEILMDTIPIPIYYKDRDGRYQGCNIAFERWFGISRSEIIGKIQAVPRGSIGRLQDSVDEELLKEAGVRVYEGELTHGQGTPRKVILSKASYRNIRGEIGGLVGALHDVSDLKEAEERVRESREMLRLVLDNIPQLVYWKDNDLRYLGVNRSFLSFFGIDNPDDVIGKTDFEFMPSEYADATEERDRRIIATGMPERVEWTVDNARDESVLLEITKVPLHDDRGSVVGTLSTAEDVTRRVSLERQLLQSQKMEAIGTLAGGIAHDFNNILTSIINSSELALLDIPPKSATSEDLERVLKAAHRGGRLVKQILAFSRPSREGFQAIRVADVIREAMSLVQSSLPRNIEVLERLEAGQAMCMADATQLHQIIMNLVTNSFHALRGTGGQLEIGLTEEMVDPSLADLLSVLPGLYLKLTIADNGPGIPPGIIDKIFDPFFTTKGKSEGTGLGLAVVHGIAKGHKGGISVSSVPWDRTAFSVYLPKIVEMDAVKGREDETAHLGEGRILFVEDDRDQLEVVPRVLAQLGYEVSAHSGAVTALEQFKAAPEAFDLVLTDFDMPEINGFELAGEIERIAPGTPVIMVSGRRLALASGGGGHSICKIVLKPYDKQMLSEAIRTALDKR